MTNSERLMTRGLRAYELGRLRVASRVIFYIVPLALFCAVQTGQGEACACLGVALLGIAVFFRWRSRAGTRSVTAGLFGGSALMVAGLLLGRFAPTWTAEPSREIWLGVLFVASCLVGGWLLRPRESQAHRRPSFWLAAAVAGATAGLGVVALGNLAVLVVAVGFFAGGAIAARLAPN